MTGIVAAALLVLALAASFAFKAQARHLLDRAATDFEERLGSLDRARFNRPPVPVDSNGAVWLTAGAEARVLKAEARLALAAGDRDGMVGALRTLARLAASLEREPSALSLLIGVTAELALLDVYREVSRHGALDRDTIAALEDNLVDVDLAESLRTVLAAEAASAVAAGRTPESGRAPPDPALVAYIVDLNATLAANLDGSLATLEAVAPDAAALGDAAPLRRNMIHTVARAQATAALRQLARVALKVAGEHQERGAWPPAPDKFVDPTLAEPFWHHELRYAADPTQDTAELSLVDAAALWRTITTNTEGEIPHRWELR